MTNPETETLDDRVVTFSRIIDAPRELVWRAWTTAEHVAQWWGPPACENLDCEIDLRVGGEFRLTMRVPNGDTYPCAGRFVEVDPPGLLVIAGADNSGHPCGAGLPPGARVTLRLEEADGKTALSLETRFDTTVARDAANASGYSTSWIACLDRMDEFAAGREAWS